MTDSPDPSVHQLREQQFMRHVERLLQDSRLRIDTLRGRRSVVTMIRDVSMGDRGVELKRTMSEMGKPDRELESRMPLGKSMDVAMSQRKWWVLKSTQARLSVACLSRTRALIAGEAPSLMSSSDLARAMSQIPPPLAGVPSTLILMSTSGFTADARECVERTKDRTLILAAPNDAGGWSVIAPPKMQDIADLFDPEGEAQKRQRVRAEIEASRVDLLSGGISTEKLASRTQLSTQVIEAELKSYAKENAGLTAKRLDGKLVLFREGTAPLAGGSSSGGLDMPFLERVKTLFSRKGEVEKKIAFLSERRAALSLQRDRSYEDMGALEGKESELRQQFKDANGDISRRRITSQLVQLRKDIERRQQLLAVLNQQINVVSTHLHNLELQQQGKTAKLPDSEEMAADAAAAEEVLAELEANSELADSVGSVAPVGMSAEEQALYEELIAEQGEKKQPETTKETPGKTEPVKTAANTTQKTPQATPRQRADAEPG